VAAVSTLQILEDVAAAEWPAIPLGLSDAAAAIAPEVIWRRVESWIAWRWGERPCTFIVEGGCGSWRPPLCPFTASTVEAWTGEAWEAVVLPADPLGGYVLGGASHYRFSGVVGSDDTPPEDVLEAYRRLAEYFAAKPGVAGSSSRSVELGGALRESYDRPASWRARGMAYSGAADLLRPYRRAP
jgi:hypothetical protein